jgi:hypothetical protein
VLQQLRKGSHAVDSCVCHGQKNSSKTTTIIPNATSPEVQWCPLLPATCVWFQEPSFLMADIAGSHFGTMLCNIRNKTRTAKNLGADSTHGVWRRKKSRAQRAHRRTPWCNHAEKCNSDTKKTQLLCNI